MTPASDMLALVAASDPALCAALAQAVRRTGFDVVTAADGASAWATFRERRPHLLLVDLALAPGAPDGVDALALCRLTCAGAHATPDPAADADGVDDLRAGPPPRDPFAPDAAPDAAAVLAPFVMVTLPRDGGADLEGALAAGADDYLTTPPSARNVAARLAIVRQRMGQAAAARRAEHALARARWLAGIGETSIALQHEINNPLAALLGHAALLEQELEAPTAPGEARELAQVVTEQAQRIAAVMKRLAALRDPRSVEYFGGARMLDLSRSALGAARGDDAGRADAPADGSAAPEARA